MNISRREILAFAAGAAVAAPAGFALRRASDARHRRAEYRYVHLQGDSMFHVAGGPIFGTVADIANLALEDSGSVWRFRPSGLAIGDPSVRSQIEQDINLGRIREGDVVAFADAGPHSQNPDAYEAEWRNLRLAASSRHNISVLMMDMFDYDSRPPAAPIPENCRYSIPFGSRTMNDATRAAAHADLGTIGRCYWVEMKRSMDASRAAMLANAGVHMIWDDGIHCYDWGLMLMVGEMLKTLQIAALNISRIRQMVRDNYRTLGFGTTAPGWDASRAMQYADRFMLPR